MRGWLKRLDDQLWSYGKYCFRPNWAKKCIKSQTPTKFQFPKEFGSYIIPTTLQTKWGMQNYARYGHAELCQVTHFQSN